jgi:GNAT superfamily N-acetyltransferase
MSALILNGEEAEIDPVVIASTHQGHGIGRALLNCAIREARALGVRNLDVRPVARNLGAIRLYHRSGFRRLGCVELFMELQPSAAHAWKRGPELFCPSFEY